MLKLELINIYNDKLKSSFYAAYFVLSFKIDQQLFTSEINQSYCADVILLLYKRNFNKKFLLMIVGTRFYQ
jgi:hypothetical protein